MPSRSGRVSVLRSARQKQVLSSVEHKFEQQSALLVQAALAAPHRKTSHTPELPQVSPWQHDALEHDSPAAEQVEHTGIPCALVVHSEPGQQPMR
jgi:hypothetical protein